MTLGQTLHSTPKIDTTKQSLFHRLGEFTITYDCSGEFDRAEAWDYQDGITTFSLHEYLNAMRTLDWRGSCKIKGEDGSHIEITRDGITADIKEHRINTQRNRRRHKGSGTKNKESTYQG